MYKCPVFFLFPKEKNNKTVIYIAQYAGSYNPAGPYKKKTCLIRETVKVYRNL